MQVAVLTIRMKAFRSSTRNEYRDEQLHNVELAYYQSYTLRTGHRILERRLNHCYWVWLTYSVYMSQRSVQHGIDQ